MTAPQSATADYFGHSHIAGAVAHLEDLLHVCEVRGLLSLEDTVDAWADLGRLRRMSRDFDCDPLEALPRISALGRLLRAALGHRMAT